MDARLYVYLGEAWAKVRQLSSIADPTGAPTEMVAVDKGGHL